MERSVANSALKWGLFLFWPVIAVLMLFCVGLMLALAWIVIPFGVPTTEGNSWTLKFPWSEK